MYGLHLMSRILETSVLGPFRQIRYLQRNFWCSLSSRHHDGGNADGSTNCSSTGLGVVRARGTRKCGCRRTHTHGHMSHMYMYVYIYLYLFLRYIYIYIHLILWCTHMMSMQPVHTLWYICNKFILYRIVM